MDVLFSYTTKTGFFRKAERFANPALFEFQIA
jgi:hypothetical protein